jgi:hypothetical protein
MEPRFENVGSNSVTEFTERFLRGQELRVFVSVIRIPAVSPHVKLATVNDGAFARTKPDRGFL